MTDEPVPIHLAHLSPHYGLAPRCTPSARWVVPLTPITTQVTCEQCRRLAT